MLACSDTADVDAILAAGLTAWTPRTIVDPERLRRELADIRQGSPAVEVGEFTTDLSCVACPVFSPSGVPVSAISVSGREDLFDHSRSAPAVRDAALALTRRLASSGVTPV